MTVTPTMTAAAAATRLLHPRRVGVRHRPGGSRLRVRDGEGVLPGRRDVAAQPGAVLEPYLDARLSPRPQPLHRGARLRGGLRRLCACRPVADGRGPEYSRDHYYEHSSEHD